jgi:ubiquinone/menaquinone biosynthesis C-methylase UbiE
MEAIARNGWQGPLAEACMSYYQDYENIKEGRYTLPWDMVTTSHRQFNPLYIARKAAAFVTEATDTLRRREEGRVEDVWIKGFNIPAYFQNTFHYQTDGWMSSRSAQVYEASTETLFVGRQDAMQRTTLLLLSDYMRGKDASQIKALEVACGTGRFATFVKDNYPSLDLTVTDLSPFYLQEARNNLKYWKRKRSPLLSLSGVDGNGVSFIQTPAEDLDIPSESMDVVYSVYLFHELPAESQEKAAAEMARVLKPGGMVVLTDSVQLGDRPSMDATLGNFGDFNEPFYRDYIERDLGALFESVGLVCDWKALNSTTKSLSFIKPSAEDETKEEDSNLPSEE